jgi:hypothetical protein
VDRGVRQGTGTEGILVKDTFRNLSLMIPLLFKVDFRPGPFRLSPLAGLYAVAPLGNTRYRRSTEATGNSFSWSTPVPLGFTLGLEGAVESGPGFLVAGMRYSGDIGVTSIDYGDVSISYGGNSSSEREYRRKIFSLYVGYAFGFSGPGK